MNDLKNRRILWVEDDHFRLRGLVKNLKENGAIIDFAADYKSAMELISQKNYDLLIVDILIPEGIDVTEENVGKVKKHVGLYLVQTIREKLHLSIPIIAMTVVREEGVIGALMKYKVASIIPKGTCHPEELESEVIRALGIV